MRIDFDLNKRLMDMAMAIICREVFDHFLLNGHTPVPMNPLTWRGGMAEWRITQAGGPAHLMPLQWADGVPPNIDATANKWWRNTGMGDD